MVTWSGRDDANAADPAKFDMYLGVADNANMVFSILATGLNAKGARNATMRFPELPHRDDYVLKAVIPG